MGVLSVVGMWAYGVAMDRHKANTLIQEAQKRAVIVAGKIGFNNQTPSLTEFSSYNTTSAGTFGDVITTGLTNQFGIQVSNVSKSVCQNILNTIGDKTPIRRLSYETTPTTPITTCKEDDDFLFVYNNDMTGENDTQYCESDESCGACGVCSSTTHVCEGECTPPANDCDDDTDCNQANECMICDTQTHKCKDGCERVAYLESTGSQYIDTGYIPTNTTGYRMGHNICSNNRSDNIIIGCRQDSGDTRFWQDIDWTNNTIGWGFGSYTPNGSGFRFAITGKDNKYIVSSMNYLNCRHTEVDGIQYDTTLEAKTLPTITRPIYLFAANNKGSVGFYTSSKIYFVKITEGTDLVRDFVPVKSPKGNCMFNKVPDPEDEKLKLYCDANGGNFKTNKDE